FRKNTADLTAACGQAALHWIYKQTIWFNNSLIRNFFAGRQGCRPYKLRRKTMRFFTFIINANIETPLREIYL
ncbi:MAG: hypothetical protein SPJ42_04965, partial [Oscillospiraceae bacterium]|nr:hypothetical protein [Oscillospiraceae bacterium]